MIKEYIIHQDGQGECITTIPPPVVKCSLHKETVIR